MCKIYQGIVYKDMYKGIDIHYYTNAGTLKYDIVVHPGADPRQVILQYDGQTKSERAEEPDLYPDDGRDGAGAGAAFLPGRRAGQVGGIL